MAFEDFCSYFTNSTICHVINKSIFSLRKRWHVFKHNYQWTPGSTAGGCVENRSSFLSNPQVIVLATMFHIKELPRNLDVSHMHARRAETCACVPWLSRLDNDVKLSNLKWNESWSIKHKLSLVKTKIHAVYSNLPGNQVRQHFLSSN